MARKAKRREPSPDPIETEELTLPADAINPYEILSLDKSATQDQVKSAYRKAALKHHPDKAQPDQKDEANKKFQDIALAYAILSDENRRRRFDTTGNTSESLDDDDFNWTEFFREQSEAVVNGDMIEQIKREYQGSDEERHDVLQAYQEGEGDMDLIYERIMCSNVLNDDGRFRKYIDNAIEMHEISEYPKYAQESSGKKRKRLQAARSEEKEAMALAEELGLKDKLFGSSEKKKKGTKDPAAGDEALKALIQQRQKGRSENFFDQLEAKYGGGKKSKRKAIDEPPEELFSKNAKKVTKRK